MISILGNHFVSPIMITKRPKTRWEIFVGSLKKGIKTIVIIEGVVVVGSYLFWRRMNHSQDFRYYLHLHYPTILECYYSVGETVSGNKQLREFDYTTWNISSNE